MPFPRYHQRFCFLLLCMCIVGAMMSLSVATAQETMTTIIVTLRDVDNVGLGRIPITVRNAIGSTILGTAQTDSTGTATISIVGRPQQVRVIANATMPNGTPLYLPGVDTAGMLLFLDGPSVQLDLRIELDGALVLDPETMISSDVPFEAYPSGTPSTAEAVPTTATSRPTEMAIPTVIVTPIAASRLQPLTPRPFPWIGTMLFVGALLCVLIAFRSTEGQR